MLRTWTLFKPQTPKYPESLLVLVVPLLFFFLILLLLFILTIGITTNQYHCYNVLTARGRPCAVFLLGLFNLLRRLSTRIHKLGKHDGEATPKSRFIPDPSSMLSESKLGYTPSFSNCLVLILKFSLLCLLLLLRSLLLVLLLLLQVLLQVLHIITNIISIMFLLILLSLMIPTITTITITVLGAAFPASAQNCIKSAPALSLHGPRGSSTYYSDCPQRVINRVINKDNNNDSK